MLDTVKLRSPDLPEDVALIVEQYCYRRSAVEISSGEVQYSITSGSLDGTFDSRVSVRVFRNEVDVDGETFRPLEPCAPYIVLEGSVHKAMLGHNVYGGPLDFVSAVRWFIWDLGWRLGVDLPQADLWQVRKVDWSEVFEFPSFDGVQEYVRGLNASAYPRRTVLRFGSESICAVGRNSTFKAYHKGPEFSKHDFKRLRDIIGVPEVQELQGYANKLLRVELSVKAKKLDEDFKGKPCIVDITRDYLERVHDAETGKILREGKSDMDTVRTHKEVRDRLHALYGRRLANTLFGTWLQLASMGESVTAQAMHRATFYRQRKQLEDASVSWLGADVKIVECESLIPKGFSVRRDSPFRLTTEHPRVVELCDMFRYAA